MIPIEITFLGTSNAIPTSKRNHPSIHLNYGAENILFDCGEGTQRQFKKANLNPCRLTRLFLTHLHGDHAFGIPGLLATLSMSEYSKTLQIYGPIGTKNHFVQLEKLYGKFQLKYEITEITNQIIKAKDFEIASSKMDHGMPTNAYSFILKDKRRIDSKKLAKLKVPNSPLLKNLQEGKDIVINNKKIKAKDLTYIQPGKKITIVLDTKINDRAIKLAKNSNLLIAESTYADEEEKYASEYKHLTATQAAIIAKKAKVDQLALTHISQRYEENLKLIESQAKKQFKEVIIPVDLQKIII